MRREMIEALSFPRMLILRYIDERECPHENLFEATSDRCSQCDLSSECHWVRCLNDFSDFADKPTYTINASLRYGVHLVESSYNELRHDETTCACETCAWIRSAQRLIEEFERSLPPNPYRPLH